MHPLTCGRPCWEPWSTASPSRPVAIGCKLRQDFSSRRAIDSIEAARRCFPDDDLVFVVGTDLVAQIPSWYAVETWLPSCSIAVVQRQGWPMQAGDLQRLQALCPHVLQLPLEIPAAASSSVRHHPNPELVPSELLTDLAQRNLYGFSIDDLPVRIALIQSNPLVGDLQGNRQRLQQQCLQAAEAGAELALAPELALWGYPPRDLLLQPALRQQQDRQLDQLSGALPPGFGLLLGWLRPVAKSCSTPWPWWSAAAGAWWRANGCCPVTTSSMNSAISTAVINPAC